jgi:hypothetical protein
MPHTDIRTVITPKFGPGSIPSMPWDGGSGTILQESCDSDREVTGNESGRRFSMQEKKRVESVAFDPSVRDLQKLR